METTLDKQTQKITIQFRVKPHLLKFQNCNFHIFLHDWSTLFTADIPNGEDPKEYVPHSTTLFEYRLL